MKRIKSPSIFLLLFITSSLFAQTNITFVADMRMLLQEGFDPNIHAMELRGSFNSWATGDTLYVDPLDDSLYIITKAIEGNPGDTVEWKFKANPDSMFTNSGWDSGDNRKFIFPNSDSTFSPIIPTTSLITGYTPREITFQADMKKLLREGFDPNMHALELRGDFNGWTINTDTLFADPLDDSLYVITKTIQRAPGSIVEWKFKANPDAEFIKSGWEFEDGVNREFVFPVSDSTLLPVIPDIYFIDLLFDINIFLEGPYNETNNTMNVTLTGSISLDSPYDADPQNVGVIPADVVDWVLVELRDKNNTSTVFASRSAFVLNTGQVVDIDGTSPVGFAVVADDYYITVKHRNHLGIMSSVPKGLTE